MPSMADLANRPYIKYSPEIEKKPPGEDEDIQAVAEQINTMQKTQFNLHRHCYTGTHVRTQGIFKGKFIVNDDLLAHLKQGPLFEKGGQYPFAARYSTEPGDPGIDDRNPQPRGFAMKLFDVHGEMFDAGKDFPTYDIEFNSTPAIELADAKTTREIFDLRIAYGGDKTELYKHLEKRADCPLQKARDGVRNTHLESLTLYSQTAYRFGDYVMKYRLVPDSETQKELAKEITQASHGPDILHRWLQDFHSKNEARWSFQVQLLENIDDQPVEYAGKEWDSEKYPFQEVAKVVAPPQDSFDYERKAFWEDHMRLDPWHGLVAYQPLGSPNRLRRVVYPASSALRRKMNARKEINVRSIDEIPN